MYKIIKIIDEYNVVVDYEIRDKAMEGDILDVYISDKEIVANNKSYGTLDIIKAQLIDKSVYSKMFLCESCSKVSVMGDSTWEMKLMKTAPLDIDKSQISLNTTLAKLYVLGT